MVACVLDLTQVIRINFLKKSEIEAKIKGVATEGFKCDPFNKSKTRKDKI